MPNWCKGNIRLRGKRESIVDFLKNELLYTGYKRNDLFKPETGALIVNDNGFEISVTVPEEKQELVFSSIYIKDTHRNFIGQKSFEVYGDEEKICICVDDFKAAWSIESGPYLDKAKKYGVDIRVVGFERGMQFMQIVEIVGGEIIHDEEITFDDWDWECMMPNMGG